MTEIVLATGNPHKVEEMRALLGSAGVRLVGLAECGTPTREPAESGSTFVENATIKALSYAAQTGLLCLADDSGLEVDALDGRPGVVSSHFATDGRETGATRAQRDEANNARLLAELSGVPLDDRTARFVCVMVLAAPHSPEGGPAVLARCRGTFEGRIGSPPRVPAGGNGFGYDPLFLVEAPPHHGKVTSAELPVDEKNRLSHRGAAARVLLSQLRALGLAAEHAG